MQLLKKYRSFLNRVYKRSQAGGFLSRLFISRKSTSNLFLFPVLALPATLLISIRTSLWMFIPSLALFLFVVVKTFNINSEVVDNEGEVEEKEPLSLLEIFLFILTYPVAILSAVWTCACLAQVYFFVKDSNFF